MIMIVETVPLLSTGGSKINKVEMFFLITLSQPCLYIVGGTLISYYSQQLPVFHPDVVLFEERVLWIM